MPAPAISPAELSLGQRLIGTLSLILVASAAAIGGCLWFSSRDHRDHARLVEQQHRLQQVAQRLRYDILQMADAMRGIALEPSSELERERKKAADDDLTQVVAESAALLSQYPELQKALAAIGEYDEQHLHHAEVEFVSLAEQKPSELPRFYRDNYLPARREAERLIADFIHRVDETTRQEIAVSRNGYYFGLAAAGTLLASALLLGRWQVGKINQRLIGSARKLGESSRHVAAASEQIAASSQSLAEGSSEQAASLEESSASLEELTSMVKRNAKAAAKAKDLAGQTRTAADTGTNDMVEMEAAMNDIRTSSAEVAKIVKDIDEIAFQTNILALNAAVEAARAGEAGMGFAVVADEVRNLAQRSARSAKETALKIEDAISKSERGVQISGRVAASFTQIAGKTREVDQFVAEIALASNEQAQGIQQVSVAVSQMDKVTQSNAATAEEAASASEELNSQAVSVSQTVAELERLVGGAKGAPAPESHAHAVHAPARPAARSNLKSPAPAKAHKSSHVKAGEVHRLSPAAASNGHAPRAASLPLPGEEECKDF